MAAALVYLGLDRVEQRWNALDLVQHHQRRLVQGGQFPSQAARILGVAKIRILIGQIDNPVWPQRARERGLPHLARPE